MTPRIDVAAEPSPFPIVAGKTALILIDMQRDFLLSGGFGESLGNDVGRLLEVIPPLAALLAAARAAGVMVIHTREGHQPDLSDCPPAKLSRGAPSKRIGDAGKYGRILIRGEYGHDIVDELAPIDGEVVIDKPGKGAFYATELSEVLARRGGNHPAVGHRGHHRGVCTHHHPGGQRPGLRVSGRIRLRGFVFPRIPARRSGNDQSAGRHLRLGGRLPGSHRGIASSHHHHRLRPSRTA